MAPADAGVERGINTGPNSRPLNDTVSSSGSGIPDDALAPGETLDDVLPPEAADLTPGRLKAVVFGEGEDSDPDPSDPDEPQAHPS